MTQNRPKAKTVAVHESFLRYGHFLWLKIMAPAAIGVAAIFLATDGRLRGSVEFTYVTGAAGAALIVWLALLGVRKRAMTANAWPLKAWVSAHVYLGLLLAVIVTMHAGMHFGWNAATLAWGLTLLAVLSGMFGVALYVLIPPKLSDNRGDLTQKQMREAIQALDARLLKAAGTLNQGQAAQLRKAAQHTSAGERATTLALSSLTTMRTRMNDGVQAAALEQALGLLREKSVLLVKGRREARLRGLLKLWLFIHVPATFALLAALTAHIVSVFLR